MKKILILIISITIISSCSLPNQQPTSENTNSSKTDTITVSVNSTDLTLQIASTDQQRAQGLMFVQELQANHGMIFVFPETQILSFWMKNTLIPLDLIFLDEDFQIVDLKSNFQPCHITNPNSEICPSYSSKLPAKYVIELNTGSIQTLNLQLNDQIPLLNLNTT